MISALLQFDNTLTTFFFNLFPHNRIGFDFFLLFSPFLNVLILWLIIIALVLLKLKKNQLPLIICLIASTVITGYLVNFPLKSTFKRERPLNTLWRDNEKLYYFWENSSGPPRDYSFPSSHAAISFAIASVLAAFIKVRPSKRSDLLEGLTSLLYCLAALIAYSRIYLGVHYALDVICGALVGWIVAEILIWLQQVIITKKQDTRYKQ